MSKQPSEATQIRNLNRDLRDRDAQLSRLKATVNEYRARATKAEQECAEWKRRFDLLLERTPVAELEKAAGLKEPKP